MIELTMCINMFLGMCGQIRIYEYASFDECYQSAKFIKENSEASVEWIVCETAVYKQEKEK